MVWIRLGLARLRSSYPSEEIEIVQHRDSWLWNIFGHEFLYDICARFICINGLAQLTLTSVLLIFLYVEDLVFCALLDKNGEGGNMSRWSNRERLMSERELGNSKGQLEEKNMKSENNLSWTTEGLELDHTLNEAASEKWLARRGMKLSHGPPRLTRFQQAVRLPVGSFFSPLVAGLDSSSSAFSILGPLQSSCFASRQAAWYRRNNTHSDFGWDENEGAFVSISSRTSYPYTLSTASICYDDRLLS